MVPNLPIERFRSGDVIFSEGDAAGNVYIIVSGKVEIFQTRGPDDVHIATLGEDEIFGDMALISDASRSASAHAVTNTSCYVISSELYEQEIEKASPMLRTILKILSDRLHDAIDAIPSKG